MKELEYTLSDEDYIEFNKYHFLNSKNGKKTILILKLIAPIVSVITLIILWFIEKDITTTIIAAVALTVVSLYFTLKVEKIFLKNYEKAIQKMKKDGKLPYSSKGKYVFGDDYLVDSNEMMETKFKYESFEKICYGERAMYIYLSSLQAIIIPYRLFLHNEERKELCEFITSKMNKELN